MPDITFTCHACEQTLEAPAEMAGETVECPSCEAELLIPSIEADAVAPDVMAAALATQESNVPEPQAVPEQEDTPGKACPECGATLAEDAVLCVGCGYHIGLGRKIDTDLS